MESTNGHFEWKPVTRNESDPPEFSRTFVARIGVFDAHLQAGPKDTWWLTCKELGFDSVLLNSRDRTLAQYDAMDLLCCKYEELRYKFMTEKK